MGKVHGSNNLHHWSGDYGLEVLFMSYSDFADYAEEGSCVAWHRTIYYEGKYALLLRLFLLEAILLLLITQVKDGKILTLIW